MSLQKYSMLIIIAFASAWSHAAEITHFGYTRDTATGIVTGGGLEWLPLSATMNMTVTAAENAYDPQGWRAATATEVTGMLSAAFPAISWQQGMSTVGAAELGNTTDFFDIFPATFVDSLYHYADGSGYGYSTGISGYFRSDDPVLVIGDFYLSHDTDYDWGNQQTGTSTQSQISYFSNSEFSHASQGVFLVRPSVSAVPLPAAGWLFVSGLFGLIVRRRFN